MADGPKAIPAWHWRLLQQHGLLAERLLCLWERHRGEYPDEALAERDLMAFLEVSGDESLSIRQLVLDPRAFQLLLRVGQVSRYAFDVIRQFPGTFWGLMQDRSYRQPWTVEAIRRDIGTEVSIPGTAQAKGAALARGKHRHWLRILIGEISGELRFSQVVLQLSDVVDVVIELALQQAVAALSPRFGTIVPPAHPLYPGLAVIGMGKLGGRELNYSSDIDLIFAYDLPKHTDEAPCWRAVTDHHDYMIRLGREVIRLLERPDDGAQLLRVDMRLRPEGDRGELALTVRETIDYYYAVGRPWERQAMIKARVIAGPRVIADLFSGQMTPWIYPNEPVWDDLEETRGMRRRIEERAEEANVKTGAGGIRDIEFLVQFFQLCYGGRIPELRRGDTLPTLNQLVDRGLMPRPDAEALARHYMWLRTVEHRLQVWEDRQEHEVPADDSARTALAGRCGFLGGDGLSRFDARHRLAREQVRAVAERHFLGEGRTQDALLALLVQGELDPVRASAALAPGMFQDPIHAAQRLRSMAVEPFFVLSRGRTERALARLLPTLLAEIASTPEPDQTLANFERVVDAVGGRAIFFEMLENRPEIRRVFVEFAGWSAFLVELVQQYPGLPDDVIDVLNQRRRPSLLLAEARGLVHGLAEPGAPLAHFAARELAAVAIRDLDGKMDQEAIGEHIAALHEAVTGVLLSHTARQLARQWGHPRDPAGRPVRFVVIGLGKLGGRELSYASDMDVIFVCDPGGTCSMNGRDGQEFWTRVAQGLTTELRSLRVCELDARLRPWGDAGELVSTTTAIEHYWSEPKDLWERMAMLRAGVVAGDPYLGADVIALLRKAALTLPLPPDAGAQIRRMRHRLEESVAGRDHIKRGPGGYVDVEFIAQAQCLGLSPEQLPAMLGTVPCLRHLAAIGRIPPAAAEELINDLHTLRQIEGRMRLWSGKAVSSLPQEPVARERIARRCGHPDLASFDRTLSAARTRVRGWFDRLV